MLVLRILMSLVFSVVLATSTFAQGGVKKNADQNEASLKEENQIVAAQTEDEQKRKDQITKAPIDDIQNATALAHLVERLAKIESISGAFVQITVDQKGVRLQESKGEFKAKRPGKFYWYTSAPLEQSIYSDGNTVTVYDPDLEQATIQKLSNEISATPAVLFSGNTSDIGKQFNVDMRTWDDVVTQFLLTPKKRDSLFEKMILKFEGAQITEMRLSDSLGQENSVSFIHTQLNQAFTEADFKPIFPEGTDIIRDLPEQAFN